MAENIAANLAVEIKNLYLKMQPLNKHFLILTF